MDDSASDIGDSVPFPQLSQLLMKTGRQTRTQRYAIHVSLANPVKDAIGSVVEPNAVNAEMRYGPVAVQLAHGLLLWGQTANRTPLFRRSRCDSPPHEDCRPWPRLAYQTH